MIADPCSTSPAEADERALSVTLDVRRVESGERTLGQEPAQRFTVGVRHGGEVLGEGSCERVRHDRPGRRDEHRRLDRAARLGPHLLDDHTQLSETVHREQA